MKQNSPLRTAARRWLVAFAAVAVMACLTACSDDYAKVLPADCAGVVKVDAKSIAEKARLGDNADLKDFKEQFRDKAEEVFSRSSRERLDEILENPAEAGIDLSRALYFFAPSKSFPYAGMVAKVLDEDDLETTVSMLLKESGTGRLKEYDECRLAVIDDGRAAVAFDGKSLIVAAAIDRHDGRIARDVRKRFAEKGENSVFDNEAFAEMADRGDDVSACLMMGNLLKVLPVDEREEIRELCKTTHLQDWSLIAGLRFGDETVEAYLEPLAGSDAARAELQKGRDVMPAVQGKFLARLADDVFFVVGSGFDGKKYWDYISGIDVVKREIDRRPEVADLVRRAVCAVGGEWTVGVAAPQADGRQEPVVEGFADIREKTAVESLLDSAMARFGTQTRLAFNEDYETNGGEMLVEKTYEVMTRDAAKGTYRFVLSPGADVPSVATIAVAAQTFGFSMRPDFSLTVQPRKSLATADYAGRIEGCRAFAVLDFRTLGDDATVRKEVERSGFEDYFDKLATAEVYIDKDMRYSACLRFRDLGKKETPLTLLTDLFSDAARKSGLYR